MPDPIPLDISRVNFDDRGLVPCVVQEWRTGEVLMMAWMNEESLQLTVESGTTWFWSRSRGALWNKGETSGNYQRVRELRVDCDGDTLLALVEQTGPACHTGTATCFTGRSLGSFGDEEAPADLHEGRYEGAAAGSPPFLTVQSLYDLIENRKIDAPSRSYTARLLSKGVEKIGAKVLEEADELVEAAAKGDRSHALYEAGDLTYHLLVLLSYLELTPVQLWEELERRRS